MLGSMLLWWSVAGAEVPESVRPVVAPADAPAQHAEWLAQLERPATPLACRDLWREEALLCFRVVEHGVRRWVTAEDLTGWGVDLDGLAAVVLGRARPHLKGRPRRERVDGMQQTYWVSAEGDGWDAALLLDPDGLARVAGSATVRVAVPLAGAVLAWAPGDAELDKVMAVGAKRMLESQSDPITAVVHEWDGTRWRAFGEAVVDEP